jgi:hypothetical protein
MHALQHFHDFAGSGCVEISGWLVRQNERWAVDQGSCNSDPLLFRRPMLKIVDDCAGSDRFKIRL